MEKTHGKNKLWRAYTQQWVSKAVNDVGDTLGSSAPLELLKSLGSLAEKDHSNDVLNTQALHEFQP